ncbi:MAG TPA: TetR/AcrR family transcriptional regulator [Thermomicrobiales bacterium]|nr:TetR/AcrR family transcriptional regulator [Thermomicrobiales bacterium]
MDTQTRREQIYDTAGALFSRRGYAATSVRDIARELDLQGGSLYAHIESKEDVLWAIVSRAADQFLATARPLAGGDAPAPARLRGMIHAHIAVVTGRVERATVFLQDWKHLSPARREAIRARRVEYEGLYRAVIAAGVARGEFAPADPKLAAMLVLSALNGVHLWYRPGGALAPDEIADRFADLLLNGLAAR